MLFLGRGSLLSAPDGYYWKNGYECIVMDVRRKGQEGDEGGYSMRILESGPGLGTLLSDGDVFP